MSATSPTVEQELTIRSAPEISAALAYRVIRSMTAWLGPPLARTSVSRVLSVMNSTRTPGTFSFRKATVSSRLAKLV